MTGDSCGLLQICLGVWWLSLMKYSRTLLASPWFQGRYMWPTSQGCYSRSPRVLRHYVTSCFLKTKAQFACFTTSGKKMCCFGFEVNPFGHELYFFWFSCHGDFWICRRHAASSSGRADGKDVRRAVGPSGSISHAGWTDGLADFFGSDDNGENIPPSSRQIPRDPWGFAF